MDKTLFAAAVLLLALPTAGGAQMPVAPAEQEARTVTHAPLDAAVEPKVRTYVADMASTFASFYPDAEFRNVRAVYFESGAVVVCGELNKVGDTGRPEGWRYFSNSGPLIFESDKLEILCDQRTYATPAYSDDHEYGPDFTLAARK
jgi:hypothetical protein